MAQSAEDEQGFPVILLLLDGQPAVINPSRLMRSQPTYGLL